MMTQIKFFILLTVISFSFVQCTKDSDENKKQVTVEMTDAPIDDPEVQAVFITVTQVKIDGEIFAGFTGKQTFNIKALQNGAVRVLGVGEADAQAANNITLVLDLDTDASGNAMGCYVQRANGAKESLAAGATGTLEIACNNAVNVASEASSNATVVMDFDLRKAIKYNSTNSKYEFVTAAELSAAVRAVVKTKTGTASGNCSQNSASYDKVVVYAYKKGTYSNSEANAQGASSIQFANAVTSSAADAQGNFNLSFLNEGEYELVCAGYDYDAQNQAEFKGTLEVGLALSGNVLSLVNVSANATATLNINVFGVL